MLNHYTNLEQYSKRLDDTRWKIKTKSIKNRDGHKCAQCGETRNLNVHHRAYIFLKKYESFVEPWNYPDTILITLCTKCHELGHSKIKVPIKYI